MVTLPVFVEGNTANKCYWQAQPLSAEVPRVILQSGTAGTSIIYTNSTSAKASIATVSGAPSKAFIAYKSNTGTNLLNSPKGRLWNGTGWASAETEIGNGGSEIQWIRTATCPISSRNHERIVISLSNDDYLDVYVWNGSSWKFTDNIGRVNTVASTYESFDLVYETSSGRAILAYAVLSSDATRDLAYRIWNGTAWSNEAYIDDSGHASNANYRWVEMDPNPAATSNGIAMIAMDQTNAHCNGWIWNGITWGNFQELENNLATVRDRRLVAVTHEQTSHQAMFVWGYSNFLKSREFNGTAWKSELPALNIAATANVGWISLKPDPVSNKLMVMTIDGGSNLNTVLWNGTTWASPVAHDAAISHTLYRCADFDWEPSGSKGLLVWSTAQNYVSYRTFTAPSTWSPTITASNPVMHPWIQLRRNSRNVNGDTKILGATLNGNLDIFGFKWNGTILTFENTAFTTDTNRMVYECFDIAFLYSNVPLNYDHVLRVTNTGTNTWQTRLREYSDSNVGRLLNLTIYLHNSTAGNSRQIYIQSGSYVNQTGPWYNLGSLQTIYIAMTVQAQSAGASYVYAYLETRNPSTTVYDKSVVAFEIT